MKKHRLFFKTLLSLSILANIYLFWDQEQTKKREQFESTFKKSMGGDMSKTKWKDAVVLLNKKLKKQTLSNEKYYYVTTWANFCIPCLKEMPLIDSIAGAYKKDISVIFVSDISQNAANYCLKQRNYNLKNSLFLNDMNDFISAVCNEAKLDTKIYPMHIILNNKGEIFYFFTGTFENIKSARKLLDVISKLKNKA